MKLYRRADGAWVGTKNAAGKDFEQVEIPTDKPGLLMWLNNNWRGADAPSPEPVTDFIVEAERKAIAATTTPQTIGLTEVEVFIQESSPGQLARVADNVCWRIKELAGGLGQA